MTNQFKRVLQQLGTAPLQSYALLKDKNAEKTQSYCEAY